MSSEGDRNEITARIDFDNGRWFDINLRIDEDSKTAVIAFPSVHVQQGDRMNKIPNILLVEPFNLN